PDGLERDRYDASGLHVGAWRNASLVGAMRLVLPSNQAALPVEEAFGIRIEPRGQVVEAGRLVIAPRYRGDPAHTAWGALFARAWLTIRGRGFSLLCGAASTVMIERLSALGLPCQ